MRASITGVYEGVNVTHTTCWLCAAPVAYGMLDEHLTTVHFFRIEKQKGLLQV